MAVFTAAPLAQEAAPPAPAPAPAIALPQVDVTTAGEPKKKAKAKAASKQAAPVSAQASPSAGSAGNPGGAAGEGGTKPGLNLDVPSTTGSRLNMTPLETPASVEIIPGTTIQERRQTSVSQAVTQNATGFTSSASPGNGDTGLATRGFNGHGSVMQLYDGTRLYVGAGTVTFPFDTWSAERIEVLRGPASVLYGEGAIGGVINVVPKKPTEYFTHEALVAIGTDATRRFGVGSGGPISDQLAYRIDASGVQSEGWMDNEHGEFSSLALSGAVTYKPIKDLKLTLSHDQAYRSPVSYWGTPLINGVIPDSIRFKSFNVQDHHTNFVDSWTQVKTEWTPTKWFSLNNIAYRLATDRHWHNVETYDYQESGANAGKVRRTSYTEVAHDQEQYGNRMDATLRANLGGGVKNELVVGFDVNRIAFVSTSNSGATPVPESYVDAYNPAPGSFIMNPPGNGPRTGTVTRQYSIFAEDRLELSKELALVAGIRLDKPTLNRWDLLTGGYVRKEFSHTPWRVGAVFTPIKDLAFYGQYSTGVDPIGGAIITLSAANANFELATGRQYEIGVKQAFWNGLGEWTLAAYDIEKQNLLSPDPNDRLIVRQVGAQSSRGIEASVALQVTETLRYEGNVAVLEAQYDQFATTTGTGVNTRLVDYSGNRPTNVPQQVINNWLSWAFMPQWEGHLGVQWVGTMYNDDANTVKRPPFTIVNLGVDYDVTKNSEIALWVFNAFDEVYAVGGNATEWQLAPPRSAELSYRIKY
ncbi:MAG: TonB-dependent siderophore receptor [Hyphomicrobium sp.]|nr:TonB-dependent siderophore receptor [Hyphomicrobium sp.]